MKEIDDNISKDEILLYAEKQTIMYIVINR